MAANQPTLTPVARMPQRPRDIAILGVLLAVLWQPVRAAPGYSYEDTADCIAVMEVSADEMARRIKAGDTARRPVLRAELVRAAALVGRVYLGGMHDEGRAKAQLNAARERQKAWDDARRSSVHGACLVRADAELGKASDLERRIAERVADARMRRMLAAP